MVETNENNENINYASLLLSLKNSSDDPSDDRDNERHGRNEIVPTVKVILYILFMLKFYLLR
jgi:hypothetical protein